MWVVMLLHVCLLGKSETQFDGQEACRLPVIKSVKLSK